MDNPADQNKTLPLDIESLPWEGAGASGISQKILKQDSDTGARTLLLRSAARPSAEITDRRPQFHPVDEEFLCLSGRFTLEGTHWLTPMTYVYYPAGLVHGFSVDVPDGYEIYLRNSGPLKTERVDSPAHDKPYFVDDPGQDCRNIIVSDCSQVVRDAVDSARFSVIALRDNDRLKEGALIACLPPDTCIEPRLDGSEAYAEILVLEGEVRLGNLTRMGKRSFAFLAYPAELQINCVERSILMLNYRGGELASEIMGQAESVHRCVNSYPKT